MKTVGFSNRAMTQAILLEEPAMPGLARLSFTLIGGIIALFLGWAAVANVDEIASASGQVIPSGYVQDIQHIEGGTVTAIMVHDGDLVEQGQPLLRLDATNADADLGQMRARQMALRSQEARLRLYAGMGSAQTLSADEQAILSSMESAREQQRAVARAEIAEKEKELAAVSANRQALEQSLALKQQEDAIYQRTLASGSSSRLMALGSEREVNELRGQLNQSISQERAAEDALSEARNHLQSIDADLKQDAMKNLGQVSADLAEVDKSISKQESAANRTVLVAPIRGLVKGLTVHTLGAVAEPGKTLLEIVPIDDQLMVEALIQPSDIGMIKPGQEVHVKVSAFDFSRFGTIRGTIKTISASTFQDDKGQSFYKARIVLDHAYVGTDAAQNHILPGMTAQADIVTGHKTVLQYLLKPLQTATATAFHEQ